MRRLLPLALLAALATTALAQSPAFDPNATVATVNGEAIKAGDYLQRLEWFRPDPKDPLTPLPAGFQVLRQMIGEHVVVQLAKSKGVAPAAPAIEARLAEIYAQAPNAKAQLAEAGRTESVLRSEIAVEESQFNLVTAGITITDQEVEKHYRDYPSEFQEPKRYKLRVIAVTDDSAQDRVDSALKGGKPFAEEATADSADPATRSKGGLFGDIPEPSLSDTTRAAVSSTPVGSTSGWIRTEGSATRVKFLVEAITPARIVPLDASLKARTRRRLMIDRSNTRNTAAKDIQAATQNATVTIASPGFQHLYAEMIGRMRQAQG